MFNLDSYKMASVNVSRGILYKFCGRIKSNLEEKQNVILEFNVWKIQELIINRDISRGEIEDMNNIVMSLA